jgi:hypothetical protein
MVYRLLPPEEFERLRPLCDRNNLPMPIPGHQLVAVIEDEGEIIARWDLLLQPHLDNGCIDEKYRGRFLNLKRLLSLLENEIPKQKHVHLYSTSSVGPNGSRILEIMGFNESPEPLYTKEY